MWIAVLILTALAVFVMLRSLVTAQHRPLKITANVDFYRSQIAEIELQQKQNLILQADAEIAKTDAARSLLKAQPINATPNYSQTTVRAAAFAILISVPAISLPIYAIIGQSQMPDLPLASRAKPDPAKARLDELITQIEARLVQAPTDTRGLELIAPLYMRANRFDDAARVLQELVTKLGSSPERETDFGEALMMANEGIISVEAYAAFERALLVNPKFSKARYYSGKAAVQDGKFEQARAIWGELVTDMPQGPLKIMVEGEIQKINDRLQAIEKTKIP